MAKGGKSSGTRPSMQNVAAYAGVSTATVSKVLQGVPTVSADNVERVQNAIEALGYRINPLAAELRRGGRRLVGAIVPSFEDALCGRLLTALEREAELRGYALATASSRSSEAREVDLVNRMHDWRVAGVIVASMKRENSSAAVLLKEFGLPAVFIDRVFGRREFDTVAADYRAALEQISIEMTNLKYGSTLLLHWNEDASGLRSHAAMLKHAFAGLHSKTKIQILNCAGPGKAIEENLRTILDRKNRPTTAIALWAPAALMLANEVRRRGWKIPGDIAIIGFESAEWITLVNPAIASITLPAESLAARAIELLFRRIDRPGEPVVAAFEACRVEYGRSTSDCSPDGQLNTNCANPNLTIAGK